MNDYIILQKMDDTLIRRFKALYMGAGWSQGRAQNRRRTVTGKLDVQEGTGGKRWAFAIRCPYTWTDTTWGDWLDLEELVNELDGLKMTDHFGAQRNVIVVAGQMESRPIAPAVDAENLWVSQVMFEAR